METELGKSLARVIPPSPPTTHPPCRCRDEEEEKIQEEREGKRENISLLRLNQLLAGASFCRKH